eukprot:gnl/TRDRNA2_/TRDRNA2_180259_c0_seq1.p1 gnl/TRDRNA2_/TRDRNA2_180259_c0~~gnl/TRDRNA2_/TRDRNA2_180259_c0_seq1.p1  ORF type:complete len:289 (+),score=119.46 gnl/TRDRNA2_/TRDRNA2_180259_c0_seq1:54-920(+)
MSPPAKKARKSFEEYTIGELSELVKQQEKASKDQAAKVAELEEQLDELKEKHPSEDTEADRLLNAIDSQLSAQMLPDAQLSEGEKEKLRKEGRDIVAIMPNVGQSLLQAVGLDKLDDKGQPKSKYADKFLNKVPSKSLPSGASLKLMRSLDFKYVKGRCELKITGTYKWFPKPKPKVKRVKKAEAAEGEEAEGEDDEEEAEGEENEEEAEKEEAEAAPTPKAKAKRKPKAKAKAKRKAKTDGADGAEDGEDEKEEEEDGAENEEEGAQNEEEKTGDVEQPVTMCTNID